MKYLKLILPFIIFVTSVSLYFGTPRLIKIESVECKSQYGECQEDLINKLKVSEGKNLNDARYDISNIFSGERNVSDFSIQFKLPNKLEVNVIIKKPSFGFQSLRTNNVALVTADGQAMAISQTTDLPTIVIEEGPPNVGEKISDQHRFALEIVQKVFYLYQIKKGVVAKDSLTIDYPEGYKIVFPLSGDVDVLVGSARLILSRLNETSKDSRIESVSIIDLRYKNPVLR